MLLASWTEIMTSNFYLKMPLTEEGLADIIKIVTMFIKTTFKDSKKVKIRN